MLNQHKFKFIIGVGNEWKIYTSYQKMFIMKVRPMDQNKFYILCTVLIILYSNFGGGGGGGGGGVGFDSLRFCNV
jgi:hypothetical protein